MAARRRKTKKGAVGPQQVPIEALLADENNARGGLPQIDALARTIATTKRIIALEVVSVPGDCYRVIAGHRRLEAARLLNFWAEKQRPEAARLGLGNVAPWPTLPCEVVPPEFDAPAWAVAENMSRENLNLWERGKALSTLRDSGGKTNGEVAKMLGMAPSGVALAVQIYRELSEPCVLLLSRWVVRDDYSKSAVNSLLRRTLGGSNKARTVEEQEAFFSDFASRRDEAVTGPKAKVPKVSRSSGAALKQESVADSKEDLDTDGESRLDRLEAGLLALPKTAETKVALSVLEYATGKRGRSPLPNITKLAKKAPVRPRKRS